MELRTPGEAVVLRQLFRGRIWNAVPATVVPDHSSAHAGVIWSLLAAGREEDARSRLRLVQASALDADRYPVKVADIEYFLGEDDSALVHARAGVAEEPEERYWPRGLLASTILAALLRSSDPAGAAEQLERSEQIDRARLDGGDEGYMPHIDLAAVDAIRGEARAACGSLRAAIAAGWSYHSLAGRDRLFENLRSDDEFRSLAAGRSRAPHASGHTTAPEPERTVLH